jgi:hypothetical protein
MAIFASRKPAMPHPPAPPEPPAARRPAAALAGTALQAGAAGIQVGPSGKTYADSALSCALHPTAGLSRR